MFLDFKKLTLVGKPGVEPGLQPPEDCVLPLHHIPHLNFLALYLTSVEGNYQRFPFCF